MANDGPDDFDAIVEGLHLDADYTVEEPLPMSPWQPTPEAQTPAPPPDWHRSLAVIAVLGAPLLLILATVGGLVLPRPVVGAIALTFVAASIYLISKLPERGPSHPDWPDDGAVL